MLDDSYDSEERPVTMKNYESMAFKEVISLLKVSTVEVRFLQYVLIKCIK